MDFLEELKFDVPKSWTNLRYIFTCILGLLIVYISSKALNGSPNFIERRVAQSLVLLNGSKAFDFWLTTQAPTIAKFYLFNYTNGKELSRGMDKPVIVQRGPYVFLEKKFKSVEDISDDKEFILYREKRVYHFNQQLTGSLSLDDTFDVPNIPAIVLLANLFKKVNGSSLKIFVPFLKRAYPFVVRTAKQLLFEGYEIEFRKDLSAAMKVQFKEKRFGIFSKRNDTYDHRVVIHSGYRNISRLQQIVTFNGSSTVDAWLVGSSCNQLRGTDGTGFRPNIGLNTELRIFSFDSCLSTQMSYARREDLKGITTFRFVVPKNTFDSPLRRKETACLALDPVHAKRDGILDLQKCSGFPSILASRPHFLFADQQLLSSVEGLKPDPQQHDSYINVEPITGKTLKGVSRFQFVVYLQNYSEIRSFRAVKKTYMPVVWWEYITEVSDEKANYFKFTVIAKIRAVYWSVVLAFTVGITLTAAALGLLIVDALYPRSIETISTNQESFHSKTFRQCRDWLKQCKTQTENCFKVQREVWK